MERSYRGALLRSEAKCARAGRAPHAMHLPLRPPHNAAHIGAVVPVAGPLRMRSSKPDYNFAIGMPPRYQLERGICLLNAKLMCIHSRHDAQFKT